MCGLLLILTQVLSNDHELHGHLLITHERKDFRNRIGEMRFPTGLNFDGKG
jgi:hypothetical protein